jgi:Flagellar hook-length control protein FliK
VQLRIEREASKREGPDIRPLWRANFSIDLEPIGPVHASIALFGERAAVTLYAERDDSAQMLREGLPILEAGLNDAALEAGELRCRAGAPSAARSAPGLFVDQAS